jgi:hypothetical protein
MPRIRTFLRKVAAAALAMATGGCFEWEANVTRGGYAFSQYRTEPSSGLHIGMLARDAPANGFTCRKGGWAHFNPDWSLRACFLAEPFRTEHFEFPAGTWVMPRADGLIVAFAHDEACQGYVCTGAGGPKGTQTSFYPNGRLKSFYPPKDTMVGAILCAASPLADIRLHENGNLSECRAAGRGGYTAGDTVRLDESGHIR